MRKPANIPSDSPLVPPIYTKADIIAFQMVEKGEAAPHQQKRMLEFLINNICQTYDLEYRGEPGDSAFAGGKRFVGLQIVKMLKLNPAIVKD